MTPTIGKVIEDAFLLIVLIAVFSFFWFHHRGKRRTPEPGNERRKLQERSGPEQNGKKAA